MSVQESCKPYALRERRNHFQFSESGKDIKLKLNCNVLTQIKRSVQLEKDLCARGKRKHMNSERSWNFQMFPVDPIRMP